MPQENGVKLGGTPQDTANPRHRRAITSLRIVESGTPWHGSMRLGDPNPTKPGCPDSTILN